MTRSASTRIKWSASIVAMLVATAASAQTPPPEQTPPAAQTPQAPQAGATDPSTEPSTPKITAPTSLQPAAQAPTEGRVVTMGPTREIKLADYTFIRFGFQVQAWYKAAQDRITIAGMADGNYSQDFYCRRCRIFVTGSVVKDINFNILLEAGNLGKADPITGVKSYAPPNVLDAYAQVHFADFFYFSGGNILLPLTRNGTQPTTTYLSIDNANIDVTPALQGNTAVLRDLGFQANGFFLADRLEYRVGVFQGSRSAAIVGPPPAAGVPGPVLQTASHGPPRFVSSLALNFWDPEKGYVNGGHYYGTKKVLGVMANFDYQTFRTIDPPAPGVSKGAYKGFSAAAFINYPLSGSGNKLGGDEIVGLLQYGYYDGGGATPVPSAASPATYPNVLKQNNFLAEGAYYNRDLKFSVFGKYEMRTISGDYEQAIKASQNITWIAGGVKYYVAPGNLMNFGLQYERIIFPDAPAGIQGGTNNITFQTQLLLY